MILTNIIVLVGNLVSEPILKKGDKYLYITLDPAETDMLIEVAIPLSFSDTITTHCKKDDLVGIKGHVTVDNQQLIIVADKVTFMSSKDGE